MAAGRHVGPAAQVEDLLGPASRRSHDLARKGRVGHWHVDACVRTDEPLLVSAGVVGPEGRPDRAGDPVNHDVGQQLVLAESTLEIIAAVRPGLELLNYP